MALRLQSKGVCELEKHQSMYDSFKRGLFLHTFNSQTTLHTYQQIKKLEVGHNAHIKSMTIK